MEKLVIKNITENANGTVGQYPKAQGIGQVEGLKPGICSITYGMDVAKFKLVYPAYLSADETIERFNASQYFDIETLFSIFELNKEGELVVIDKPTLESQRGVISEVVKRATLNLLQGKGLMKVSLPARLFNPISSHEGICKFLSCLDNLKMAAQAANPLERFQHVIGYFVGGFMISPAVKKPFNSLIGDTFNGYFADGSHVFVEFINHDPPIDAFILENPKYGFKVYGKLELAPKLGANEIKICFKGLVNAEIKGEKFHGQIASFVNRGLLLGQLKVAVEDAFYFYYPSQKMKSIIKIGKDKKHDLIRGGIYEAPHPVTFSNDKFASTLFKTNRLSKFKDVKCLSVATGTIFNALAFDGKEIISRKSNFYKAQVPVAPPLPSDFRFRDDILYFWRGNYEAWDQWKLKLEDINREWRKVKAKVKKSLPKQK